MILLRRLTICFVMAVAFASASAQTQLPWSVVGSGGNVGAIAGGRVLSGTLGQVIVGVRSLTDGRGLSQGFWLPLVTPVGVDEDNTAALTGDVSNYPNPFQSTTTFKLNIPVEGAVTIRVFDLVGNVVRTIQAEISMAGGSEVYFDGTGDGGSPLGAGTYLYEVSATGIDGKQVHRVQRLTILR